MLRLAAVLAVSIAVYHGVLGHQLLVAAELPPRLGWIEPSFHIGTMGWFTGGLVLALLPRAPSSRPIVWALVPLFLLPGLGNAAMHGGRPDVGWITLLLIAGLAGWGGRQLGRTAVIGGRATPTAVR